MRGHSQVSKASIADKHTLLVSNHIHVFIKQGHSLVLAAVILSHHLGFHLSHILKLPPNEGLGRFRFLALALERGLGVGFRLALANAIRKVGRLSMLWDTALVALGFEACFCQLQSASC